MFSFLNQHSIDSWYSESIDRVIGGYKTHFSHDGQPAPEQPRIIVTQARLIWTALKASSLFRNPKTMSDYAELGVEYLSNELWDEEFGGFFNLVSENGEVIPHPDDHSNSFVIYGLAACTAATGDQQALNLAIVTFRWFEENA